MIRARRGFTLVELMLAMSFLSVLLLAIAGLIIQVTGIYTKGVTLSAVDRAGQAISSEIQNTLDQSSPDKVHYKPIGNNGGRLCTGSFTYVWNFGAALNGSGSHFVDVNKYGDGTKDIHFIKVSDTDGALCVLNTRTNQYPAITKADASELLPSGDRNVALHGFSWTKNPITTSNQTLYAITMTLGTNDSSETQGALTQTECKPPKQAAADYCAVNTFSFTARAGNQNMTGGN